MKYLIPALLMSSSLAFAEINKNGEKAPTSKKEFCKQVGNSDYFKGLLYSNNNQLAFTNHGGLMNGGVCWWHSMLTRNVQYLTVYRPELPKPSAAEAEDIVRWISMAKGVVEIPGYSNFRDFSRDFYRVVQNSLEASQIGDGGFALGFIRGISGSHIVAPEVLQNIMDETYQTVKSEKRVAFQKLQIEGVEAHAWLVVDMEKTANGYILDIVDSNYGGVSQVTYTKGMTQFSQYRHVPYNGRNAVDYHSYAWAAKQYCKYNQTAADMDTTATNGSSY